MSEFFPCWILKPDLFFSFFKKYPAARKLLAAALTGFPPKRLVSVLWYPGSLYEGGFCLQVRPDNRASFILELVPVFSGQLPFAVSESPPENASFTVPRGNFLQVFLTFQEANQQNPFFYGNFDASSLPFSRRVLNLSALQPSLSAFPDLYAFSRFLLVRHSSELPSLARRFPALSSVSPILEEVLREQELRTLFAETPHFSPEASCGMASLRCAPSTGCCSVRNALMSFRKSPMTRKHWKNCSWISAKRGFYKPDRKRTRAAYTGPKKREKSIYEKASLLCWNLL